MSFIPGWVRLLVLAVLVAIAAAGLSAFIHHQREIGRNEVRAEWRAHDLAASEANAKETKRRLEAQQENQRAQNQELAAARRDADRNARDAERVRGEYAAAAKQWRDALRNSPSRADLEAAGAAIVLLTDLLGRSDHRAGELAAFADASRAAGIKCERDYDSLSMKGSP